MEKLSWKGKLIRGGFAALTAATFAAPNIAHALGFVDTTPAPASCRARGGFDLGDILDPEAPDNTMGAPMPPGVRRNRIGVAVPDQDYGSQFWMRGQRVSGFYFVPGIPNVTIDCYFRTGVSAGSSSQLK